MTLVASTCSERFASGSVLLDPSETGLPAGLLVSSCLAQVAQGTAYISVVNVGTSAVLLYPRTALGILSEVQVVSLPAGVTEDRTALATVDSQIVPSPGTDRVLSLDLPALTNKDPYCRGTIPLLLSTSALVLLPW